MSTQTVFVPSGATSVTFDVNIVQKASATSPGDPLTGLAYNTGSLTCYYCGGVTGATSISLVTQTSTGAYSSGGFVERSSTNQPGVYRFDLPDSLVPTSGELNVTFNGAASMATHTVKIIPVQQFYLGKMAESYAADGTAPTLAQSLFLIQQVLTELSISGTTGTVNKLDGTTQAAVLTYNQATNPTAVTRSA